MAHLVDTFFQIMGWSDIRPEDRGFVTTCMVNFVHYDLAIILFFAICTCVSIIYTTVDLSFRFYGILLIFVESLMVILASVRFYHQSLFRDMYQRSLKVGIPENYRWKIEMMIKYHFITSHVLVAAPLLYVIFLNSVHIGDQFTFPNVDVFPIKTANVIIYLSKYIVYSCPAYITHFEVCFINTSFMYSTGVVKRHFEILDKQVEEAMETEDEQKLKTAIKNHQDVLKFFKDMKTVYEKPILLAMAVGGILTGFTFCIAVQVLQGVIDKIILAFCMASNVLGIVTTAIYCVYASYMFELQNGILKAVFTQRSSFSRNKSFTRLILMMMTRATVPLELTAYSIVTVNLNLLIRVLKYSYTVLNVLLTSLDRKIK